MFKNRALLISLLLGPGLACGCRSKPFASAPDEKPRQMQAASSKISETPEEKSCRTSVQNFYDWRVSLLVDMFCSNSLEGTNASQESINNQREECRIASTHRGAEKLKEDRVLSPELLRDLKQEEAVQEKEKDVGLDFDPYLNTQDPSPEFIVDSVRVNGNRCDAIVHGYDQGAQREEVMPELSKASGRWIIVNFHYRFSNGDGKPPQDDDLIHMIRGYLSVMK